MNVILAIVALTLIAVLAALISLRVSLCRGARPAPEPDFDTDSDLDPDLDREGWDEEGVAAMLGSLEKRVG